MQVNKGKLESNKVPEQAWTLELGFGRQTTISVSASAVLLYPILGKAGGRKDVHQHIMVLQGSEIHEITHSSCPASYADVRRKILALYCDDHFRLTKSLVFSSLGAAACVLNGNSKNGRDVWKLQLAGKEYTIDQALKAESAQAIELFCYEPPSDAKKFITSEVD